MVFLGEDDGTFGTASGLARALERHLYEQARGSRGVHDMVARFYHSVHDAESISELDKSEIRNYGVFVDNEEAWDCLEKLLARPWFSRVWVLQEIFVSTIVRSIALCGSQELDWTALQLAIIWVLHRRYHTRSYRSHLGLADKWLKLLEGAQRQSNKLEHLLRQTSDFQATDPRDKIFSLVGMASDCQTVTPSAVQPDYHKATASVYSDATRYMIQSGQGLDVLSQVGYVVPYQESVEKSQVSFPSWVPR